MALIVEDVGIGEGIDEYLEPHDDALFYYGDRYRRFLVALLGCRPHTLVARRDGRIVGLLPVMEADGPLGRVVNALPYYGSHGGPIADDAQARAALVGAFSELAAAKGVAAATLIEHPLHPLSMPSRDDFTDSRVGQITLLPRVDERAAASAAILATIDGSARRNFRKAEASGVSVRVDCSRCAFLETVHRETMAAIGGNGKTPAFFATFPRCFRTGRDWRLWVAEVDGEPVAALLTFYYARTVEYFTPVTRQAARPLQPMAAILHEAMVDATLRGHVRWNWGGTWPSQDGVYRFKRKWGAKDYAYRYHVRVNRREILRRSPGELTAAYPGFYTVPFSALANGCPP